MPDTVARIDRRAFAGWPGSLAAIGLLVIALGSASVRGAPGVVGPSGRFMTLGDLGGAPIGATLTTANAVSDDGTTVVGQSVSAGTGDWAAYRWTEAAGMMSLDVAGASLGVSGDGSVIVGYVDTGTQTKAFHWDAASAVADAGFLPEADFSDAWDVSSDGKTVIGHVRFNPGESLQAYRWTRNKGMVLLDGIPADVKYAEVKAISGDRSTIVGVADGVAFRWTPFGGFHSLGTLPARKHDISTANGASYDGAVIVGTSQTAGASGSREAFVWTARTGMVGLGDLAGGTKWSAASDVSADGTVVVGSSGTPESQAQAFVWRETRGMRSVQSVLEEIGVDLSGWQLLSANGVSADGQTVIGSARNPDKLKVAWLADIRRPPNRLPEN